jgi:hypothetical protein
LRIIDSDQTFCGPRVVPRLRLAALLDPLVQRLEDSRIYGGNHINRRVQFFFGHPCFPCVRKAPVHSRIAQAHHRYGQAHEHFLTFRQAFDRMGVLIEGSKVGFLDRHNSSLHCQNSRRVTGRKLQNPRARRHQRDYGPELPNPS